MKDVEKLTPAVVNPIFKHALEKRIKINALWDFKLDPDDVGLKEKWYEKTEIINEKIKVPGSWQGQGFGSKETEPVWDFGFNVRVYRATYKGTAWYTNRFTIPEDWQGKRIWINFGGIHPSADIWINGKKIGENHLPFVPFGFDITDLISILKENEVTVRVYEDNRILGFAYNSRGNWSGIYRDVELTATGHSYISNLRIYPDIDSKSLKLIIIGNFNQDKKESYHLDIKINPLNDLKTIISKKILIKNSRQACNIKFDDIKFWSPDSPNLYRIDAALFQENAALQGISDRFGFVKLTTSKKHILINGEPYYLRGTGDHFSQVETGCPDWNRERWKKRINTLKKYGYNYIRCQSFVYGPEFYDIADEEGMLVQSEMGMLGAWGGKSEWHIYQWPQPMPDMYERIKRQWDLIVERDINHPSANMYNMSNEYGFTYPKQKIPFPRIARKCYFDTKAKKPTALVIPTDGGYYKNIPSDFVNHEASLDKKIAKPLIQHEFRWWSSYPDIKTINKYSGAIRPIAQEIAIKAAKKKKIFHVLDKAAVTTQKLQYIEAKAKMENCRRDYPTLAGINHFNAMDITCAPEGIIDEFYDKKYADSSTWWETNGDTVILSSMNFDDRVKESKEKFECSLYISDFSHPPFKSPELDWEIKVGGNRISKGTIKYKHSSFKTCKAGKIIANLPELNKVKQATLFARLIEDGRIVKNSWSFWVFPKATENNYLQYIYNGAKHTWIKSLNGTEKVKSDSLHKESKLKVILTEKIDKYLLDFAKRGGRIILAASEGLVRPMLKIGFSRLDGIEPGNQYFFTPPSLYPTHEDGHQGTIIADHPILKKFPHEGFADYQFYRMIYGCPAIDLEAFDLNMDEPVIRVLHSYAVARPLAYLIECKIGKGGMIICALNLDQKFIEARHLLNNIYGYAGSSAFKPSVEFKEKYHQKIVNATNIP